MFIFKMDQVCAHPMSFLAIPFAQVISLNQNSRYHCLMTLLLQSSLPRKACYSGANVKQHLTKTSMFRTFTSGIDCTPSILSSNTPLYISIYHLYIPSYLWGSVVLSCTLSVYGECVVMSSIECLYGICRLVQRKLMSDWCVCQFSILNAPLTQPCH